jgi:hypothetical protein
MLDKLCVIEISLLFVQALLDFLEVCFRIADGFSGLSDGSIGGSQSYKTGERRITRRKPWFFGRKRLVCDLESVELSKLSFWISGGLCFDPGRRCPKLKRC